MDTVVIETRVAAGSDDAEERSSGSIYLDSSDLEIVDDGSRTGQTVGLRFTNIAIPPGSVIVGAYIQFTADEPDSGAVAVTIHGEATDDAETFTSTKFDISSRSTTEASVDWQPDAWSTGDAGLVQQSPDLSAIVQEIVDRPGWLSSNDIVFIFTGSGERTAESFEGSATQAPVLYLEIVPGEVQNQPPTITSPSSVQIVENSTAVVDVEANDDAPGLTFSITGGADAGLFQIHPTTGALSFVSPPSFDAPADAGADNVYDVEVTATDAEGLTDVQAIAVTVTPESDILIYEKRIAIGQDDVEERSTGSISFSSSDLDLVNDGAKTGQTIGMRFTDIQIPHGSVVVNAWIQFQADEVQTGATSLIIHGEATDDAAAFTSTRFDVSSRAKTSASVNWVPEGWLTIGEAGAAQRTPNLAAIIQEIIDRPGWFSSNDLVLTISGTGERTAEAFEGAAGAAPLLHIEVVPAAGGNRAPLITTPDTAEVVENRTAVLDVDAVDDAGGLAFSISGGADAARFRIDPGTGVLSFVNAPDFENPTDADANNVYDVDVTVTDAGGLTATQSITVTVTNENEGGDAPAIYDVRIASGADDVEERASGSIIFNSSDLDLVDDGAKAGQTIGLRFNDLDITRGSIVLAAWIQFQADETQSGATSLTIHGHAVDDAPAFTAATFDVTSRTKTTASVDWTPDPWLSIGEAGAKQRTPDLAAVVQEILDRPGWLPLNDLAFMISGTGERTAEAFEGNAGAAPLLHLEIAPPGNSSAPVMFDLPPDVNPAPAIIGELSPAGTSVGITASATDPDQGDSVTYRVDDPRFNIDPVTGIITRSGVGILDFESEPVVNVLVTAMSSDFSRANQGFAISITDDPEPVAFGGDRDLDPSGNRIAVTAPAGTEIGITAFADDPDGGDSVTYSITDTRFAIDQTSGIITRSSVGVLNYEAEPEILLDVTATSSDGTTDTATFSVRVLGNQLPSSLRLIRTTDMSQLSPPSPDSSGITYISHLGNLLVSDSEVNEIPSLFTGDNLFEMTFEGTLVSTSTTISFSDEPAGITYNPVTKSLFISDDAGPRGIYEQNPGGDGLYNTADDIITFFRTSAFGSSDPEGVAYDTTRDLLYVVEGVGERLYTIDPGPNGRFDGVASEGGDDLVTSVNLAPYGIQDPEGIAYDAGLDILFVIATPSSIAMLSTDGDLLGMLDTFEANANAPAGLTVAPSSAGASTSQSLYMVDRGEDNDSVPDENDGRLYELGLVFDDLL